MSRLQRRLSSHFAACAATAIATVPAATQTGKAAVVYYEPEAGAGWIVPATIDGKYINVETQATGTAGSAVAGWDINPYSATSLTWFNATGTGMLRYPGVTTGSAGNLPLGTVVGATGSYGSGAVVVGAAAGNWQLNTTNYFGFRFQAADGLTHYGWGSFLIGSSISGGDRTITAIGYESVAGVPINVGGSVSPVPGPLPIFGAAAAFGWSRRLRRRCRNGTCRNDIQGSEQTCSLVIPPLAEPSPLPPLA